MIANEDKLLAALAAALLAHPRGTLKVIAEAAGVSKATLHRYCGTRENLKNMLLNHSAAVITRIISQPDLQEGPVRPAFEHLLHRHLAHREVMAYAAFNWSPDSPFVGDHSWLHYTQALDAFFLRGQKEGVFAVELSAAELTEMFGSVMFGLLDAQRRGRVATARLAFIIKHFFTRAPDNGSAY
ncbi:TetR/AcrR family transcriptional regulator [Pseudomonas atacamensis]|uniref:TetR/AcrR family transcriptional regulator n=1 Tax=Pseudomonas atacamensis TaxID=2565368 RepID=UPI00244D0B48|nr:TetR/AcrR family transcriptional regulator [Pseudomonas atacamensis]MDH2076827.1 TetR/AcrR family transcriptional regulator [Pseudomonas atacamensis]